LSYWVTPNLLKLSQRVCDIDAEVEVMLKEGVIQPSQRNWAAPVLLSGKKMAGSALITTNSTRLQRRIVTQDSTVLVESSSGASGYWQMPMAPGALAPILAYPVYGKPFCH